MPPAVTIDSLATAAPIHVSRRTEAIACIAAVAMGIGLGTLPLAIPDPYALAAPLLPFASLHPKIEDVLQDEDLPQHTKIPRGTRLRVALAYAAGAVLPFAYTLAHHYYQSGESIIAMLQH